MTETPNGPQDPQQNDSTTSPQPGRPPYAGPEWRRADAADTAPQGRTAEAPQGPAVAGAEAGFGPAPRGGSYPADAPAPSSGAAGAEDAGRGQPGGRGAQAGYGAAAGGFGAGAAGGGYAAGSQYGSPHYGATQPGTTQPGTTQPGTTQPGATQPGATQYGGPQYGATQHGATQYGATRYGAARYGGAQQGSTGYGAPGYGPQAAPSGTPWPYAAPVKDKHGGRRLVAVAALTAVLGGLAGGGTVALLDGGGSPAVSASGITIDGSSAPAAATRTGSVEAAAATAMKSVVTLSVRGSQESGTGSGVVLRSDGYILTNEHVTAVAGSGGSITVTFPDGSTAAATIVGQDKATDLAVVKVRRTGLTAATFADSRAVKVGQTVVAVGSPLGLDGTVTEGIVSALHRPTSGGSDNSAVIDALQTDAAINPGNSGGALVDLAGRVVGINQSIATASSGSNQYGAQAESGNIGIGFAIPSDTAVRVASELIANGTATHAYLGVQTQSATDQSTQTTIGATLASVQAGGPAAAAGLKAGDVVVKVDDRVIAQSEELVAAVRSYAPGTKVTLTVRRDGATRTVAVTLGSDATQ